MKHRKLTRILSALLALTLLLTVAPRLNLTAKAATTGTCGENLTWSFDTGSGALTISGYGDMYDFEEYYEYNESGQELFRSTIPWRGCKDRIISVSLLDGLTYIGSSAFLNCVNLKSVSIPDGVTGIGYEAFFGCERLQNVIIPDSVTHIGAEAFTGCASLRSIIIPDKVTRVELAVFYKCSNLESVVIPDGVTSIGDYAFEECKNLKSVTLPDGVTTIGHSAFKGCDALQTVNIPDTVTSIGHEAFFCCGFSLDPGNWTQDLLYLGKWLIGAKDEITGANIRPGTRGIAYGVFEAMDPLTSVTLPEGLEYIGDWAFGGCENLGYVKLPGSLKRIGHQAFSNTDYYYNPGNWTGDCLYLDDWLLFAQTQGTLIEIREGTRGIADDAFIWCDNLFYVLLPESMTIIGNWALSECYNLKKVMVLNENCTICDDYEYSNSLGPSHRTTIVGHPLSAAEAYARKNGYQFEDVTEEPFIDVLSYNYYADPVAWAVENEITNGTAPHIFSPNSTCTRAQVVTFLWRAAGRPLPASRRNPFEDVAEDQYYYDAVLWAVEQGITTGVDAKHFAPNSACTRAQVVTFLWRAEGKPAPENTVNPFKDVDAMEYYGTAVAWAVEKGITRGTSADKFSPESTCTRAQVVTFLYRTEHPFKNKCKVGIVLAGDENEGYSYAHIHGVETAMEKLGIDKNTEAVWKYYIAENETCYDAIADCIDQDCNIVFTNAYGHQSFAKQQAEENPNVQIVALTGDFAKKAKLPNFHNASTEIYEARYAAGVVAGMKIAELDDVGMLTDANFAKDGTVKVGYVGAYPYAEVVSGYTAFFLGIKSVYENVSMEVLYTNSWFDITAENEVAVKLIADGCVIIGQHSDSSGAPTACEAALKAGTIVYSVGYNVDMLNIAPTAALTSPTNHWEVYYEYALSAMLKGEPIVTDWAEGFDKDAVSLTRLGSSVASGTREAVDKVIANLKAGKLHVFDTGTFTVGSAPVTSAFATDTNGDFVYDSDEAIFDGYYHECYFRSAPSFSLRIDGITELN